MDIPGFDNAASLSLAQSERGLASIRRQVEALAAEGDDRTEQLKNVTQEFEALFLGYLFKVMRSTVETADPDSDAPGKDIYLEMFDNEIASSVSRSRPLGLGEMMYKQLAEPKTSKLPEEGAIVPPVVGPISSSFGPRPDPIDGGQKFHDGLDIAAPAGSSFRAAIDGTVVYTGVLGGYGNTVVLEHSNGDRSLYAHASNIVVHEGEKVQAGQVIGTVGSTGRSTGPHLHFELQRNGQKIDPEKYLAFNGE